MLRKRNTKIIATLGPSSSSPSKIHSIFQAGADIFRLNFSHGSHENHRKTVFHIRQYEKRLGRPIAILGDLQGPKIRIGMFKKTYELLKNNQRFILDLSPKLGDCSRVFLPHKEIFKSVKKNLPNIVSKKGIDFVCVNGENAASEGVGLTENIANELFNVGVDVITTGNHVWDQKETFEFIKRQKRLLIIL